MPLPRLVAIPCKLFPGMFSTERVFEVRLANGDSYTGLAPSHFCWNQEGNIVSEEEPTDNSDGKVAARIVEELDDYQISVEVPDGEVLAVARDAVGPRPTPIYPPGTSEERRNVPVRP